MPADLNAAAAEVRRLAEAAFAELVARINAGEASRDAIAEIQARFSGKYAKALAKEFTNLLGEFIGVGQVRALPIGRMKLSARLYENADEVTREVRRTIANHAKGMAEARTLALQLFEGYGFKGGADPLKVKAALPKYLAEVLQDAEFGAAFKPLARRISQSVAKTEALKASYMQALETVIKGKGADRLERALRIAQFERNRYFANRIAQTELHRADTARLAREVMADTELEAVQIVLSGTHPREDICDLHAGVDKHGLGRGVYPKALAPQPPFHPFCLPGDALITSSARVTAVSKRWFEGDLAVVTTASGKRLAATVNHPILTRRGWVGAGLIHCGDHVVSRVGVERVRGGEPNHEYVPASIAEIVDSFLRSREVAAREVPTSAEHFHGDGVAGQVAVIGADRELWDWIEAARPKHVEEAGLVLAPWTGGLARVRGFAEVGEGAAGAATGFVCRVCEAEAFLGRSVAHAGEHGGAATAAIDAGLLEAPVDDDAADTKLASEIQNGSTGEVFADKVVNVERQAFHGFVFNLETESGHFTSNGIVTHNCRCLVRKRFDIRVPAGAGQEIPGADRDWLRASGRGGVIMGSRDRLAQVLGGRGVENVLNDGKDPLYHLRRMGDPESKGITSRKTKAKVAPVVPPPPAPVVAPPIVPATLDDFLAAGKRIRTDLPLFMAGREADWHNALIDRMMAAGRLGAKAEVSTGGEGSKLVRTAATFFPKTWVDATNALGELKVKTIGPRARAHAWTAERDYSIVRLADWGIMRGVAKGEGRITVGKDDLATAIHEYGHRVQSALPALDDVFQQLHRRRVAGAPVRRIKDIGPQYKHYPSGEVAREDGYLSPYQGKEYKTSRAAFGGGTLEAADGGALEVLTMAVETVLGGNASRPGSTGGVLSNWQLREMFIKDREMVDLVLGLVFHWNP